jgi:hypothetical protein
LRGEVHDENAFALGGVAGHAGLFSTAADLAVFAQMMLEGGSYAGQRIVSENTVALFTRRSAGRRALGWDTCDGGSGCGQYMGAQAFGHTGYTGTSLWIDPERQMFVVLLTNRVHAARARRPSKVIADVRNDLSDAAVLAVMDDPAGVLAMPASFRADVAEDWDRPLRSRRAMSAAARRKAAKAAAAKRAAAKRAATKRATAKQTTAKRTTTKTSATRTKSVGTATTKPTPKASAKNVSARKAPTSKAGAKVTVAKKSTAKSGRKGVAAKKSQSSKKVAANSSTAKKRRSGIG